MHINMKINEKMHAHTLICTNMQYILISTVIHKYWYAHILLKCRNLTDMHAQKHNRTYVHANKHILVHKCMHSNAPTAMHKHTHQHACLCTHTNMHTCMLKYLHTPVCTYSSDVSLFPFFISVIMEEVENHWFGISPIHLEQLVKHESALLFG